MSHPILKYLSLTICSSMLFACASSYIPPGPRADLQNLAPQSIQQGFDLKPSLPFPSSIAMVRIQGAGYSNYELSRQGGSYGLGRYTVVLNREVETEVVLDSIAKLPQVNGLVSLNRLLLPAQLNSDADLRAQASRLQAGLMLVYTFDTQFYDLNESRALSTVSLGFAQTKRINVVTSSSALLLDTRTGYIYAAYEATAKADAKSNVWDSQDNVDILRKDTEKRAFEAMVKEMSQSWKPMLARHGK